ncbi:MAG: nuclease-related domain-containing protein [Candidatus Kapabacteria bacterium]|nr:nuclease-related domain-containing protein [Candidatus Kapabacteria bacterium]
METTVDNEKLNFEKVWAMFQETDRRFKETDELLSSKFLETEKSMKETDKQIKELGKQIGGLGNKFGTFNEGLVLPSLYKLFEEKFQCRDFAERYRFNANGSSMEIDLLAISEDSCYLIEIKSHFKPDAIEQLQKQIERFRKFKKEYTDRKLYGVIVATHYEKENIKELLSSGIYFISISDDLVSMKLPNNFEPRVW